MKNLLIIFSLVFTCFSLQGQRSAFYVEGLGNGIIYSVNYEHQLIPAYNIGLRVGAGILNTSDVVMTTPVHLNVAFGEKHALELAGGISMLSNFKNKDYAIAPSSSVMYRMMLGNGLLVRAGLTQTYSKELLGTSDKIAAPLSKEFLIYPGLSVGYRF